MASPSPVTDATTTDAVTPVLAAVTSRRRQRSVRITVATALLGLATLVVLLTLPGQSPLWLSVAAVFTLLCGATASRIVYSELVQSRREAQRDRSAQAKAYTSLFSERAHEHAAFTSAMTDRLARRDREVTELEGAVVLAEKRALEAETRVQREARRATEALERVTALEEDIEILKAEHADELASWGTDLETGLEAGLETGLVPSQAQG
jgi:hypothetical protein